MCNRSIVIVATAKVLDSEKIGYGRHVRHEVQTQKEDGVALHFSFGKSNIDLPKHSIISIVFDPGTSDDLMKRIKNMIKIRKKGENPIFLSRREEDKQFGCIFIEKLSHVRSFLKQTTTTTA